MLGLCLTYLEEQEDKNRFEEIYCSYRKQMVSLALSILHNKEDAEDVVSVVFLRIAQHHWHTIQSISDERDVRNRMEYDQVVEAIRSLEEKYRDALYYRYVLELSVPETAKSLQQTLAATRKQLVRGKKILLEELEKKRNAAGRGNLL